MVRGAETAVSGFVFFGFWQSDRLCRSFGHLAAVATFGQLPWPRIVPKRETCGIASPNRWTQNKAAICNEHFLYVYGDFRAKYGFGYCVAKKYL